jgi:hypothetical protein
VYGRENRLKVARDEAKHKEEEDKKREKHLQVFSLCNKVGLDCRTIGGPCFSTVQLVALPLQAERDHKRYLLLQRAALRSGIEIPELPQARPAHISEDAGPLVEERNTDARPSGHINFFEDFEAREMHPEVC